MILSVRLKSILVLSSMLAFFAARSTIAQQNHSVSIGANYTYVRTNLVSGCNCFGLNGGGAEVQFGLSPRLALLGDLTVTHRSDITSNHYDLTQFTYAGGIRYFRASFGRLRPFGNLLAGGAHTSGSLSPSETGRGGANAFLFEAGGGVGISFGHRWALIPVRASYLLTTFSNGYDDHQNDLRISAGLQWRLSKR